MNTATKNLEDDHVQILRLIDVMDRMAELPDPDISHLETIIGIIRDFADGIHHAKEEHVFFPALTQKGFSLTQGPVAVMLDEHAAGRTFVKGIADNILLYKTGKKEASGEIRRNMKGYAELLRSHIAKENNVLFRMADRVLSEAEHSEILSGFSQEEKIQNPSLKYVNQIDKLSELYII